MTRKSIFLLGFYFLFCAPFVFSQDKHLIDSLKTRLSGTLNDSDRVNSLAKLGWEVSYNDLNEGLSYCLQAKSLAEKIGYKSGLSQAFNNMGAIYTDLGDYTKAIESHLKQIEIAKALTSKRILGTGYSNLSRVFSLLNDNEKSREYERMALAVHLKNYDEEVAKHAANPRVGYTQINEIKLSIALLYNNISESFVNADNGNNTDSALAYISKSIKISEELHNEKQMAIDYQTVGRINLYRLKSYDNALLYFNKAKEYYKDDNGYDLSEVYYYIGQTYFLQKKYPEAISNYTKAILFARKVGVKERIKNSYGQLSALYEETGDLKNSLSYYKKYSDIKDSIVNESRAAQFNLVQSRIDNEKKNAEIVILEEKNKAKESETARQKTIIYSAIILLLVAALLVYILYLRNNEKVKANKLLEGQKKEIELQKQIVDVQNKEITDSINYAQRIQQVILPHHEEIGANFKDCFIFFQPKDVVSGDFYWFAHKDDRIYIAAVDCTGHGIPGAFMSMIGYTLLNEILNDTKIVLPADVLNELRKGVIKSLKQKGVEGENKDGMDISLCLFQSNKLYFSGANNPLWLVRNNEIVEYKGDKQPIGIYGEKLNPFTNYSIDIQGGDAIYIFTDGYADQFGGPQGKKFKYAKLKELLLSVQKEKMNVQKEIITRQFADWKGNLEQIDDVLLIGIKI